MMAYYPQGVDLNTSPVHREFNLPYVTQTITIDGASGNYTSNGMTMTSRIEWLPDGGYIRYFDYPYNFNYFRASINYEVKRKKLKPNQILRANLGLDRPAVPNKLLVSPRSRPQKKLQSSRSHKQRSTHSRRTA